MRRRDTIWGRPNLKRHLGHSCFIRDLDVNWFSHFRGCSALSTCLLLFIFLSWMQISRVAFVAAPLRRAPGDDRRRRN